jgi:hypothetical protein
LRRDVESVPSRMLLETSGREPEGTFRSITFHQTKRSWGTQLFKNGGVTYVTWKRVAHSVNTLRTWALPWV